MQPTNPYAQTWTMFQRETADHELSVRHDDGVYRHLRMQAPGTSIWHWDVVTWPGHLATAGDVADGYTFRRLHDMVDFFTLPNHLREYFSDGAPCIDVRYWAEKLCGGRSHAVKIYDPDRFLRQVREHLAETHEPDGSPPSAQRSAGILADARNHSEDECLAHRWLAENEDLVGSDTWEWDLRDFDIGFLYTCYAIERTVRDYRSIGANHR